MKLPEQPVTGDRGRVHDALRDAVDAGGGVKYTRGALIRTMAVAQEEFNEVGTSDSRWMGASSPAVFYEFCNVVGWTRTVVERFEERLGPAVNYDRAFWDSLQRMRGKTAGREFEDARHLAGLYLHRFTPPHPAFTVKVDHGLLVYLVIDRRAASQRNDYPHNLCFEEGRHVAAVVDQFWEAISNFIDRLLDEFYPPKSMR